MPVHGTRLLLACLLLAPLGGCDDPGPDTEPTPASESGADPGSGASAESDPVSPATDPRPTSTPETDSNAPTPPTSAAPIDCANALPCRFESADGALAITVTAADGEALDGGGALRVDFVVEALSRDTRLALGRDTALIAGGQVLEAETLRLGATSAAGARDEAETTLLAGVPINGHAIFGGALVGNPVALDRLTLSLSEADRARPVGFAAVPLGPAPSAPIDCAGLLPCEWRSAPEGVTLTLRSVAPLYWNRSTRLALDWTLATVRPLELVAFPGVSVAAAGGAMEIYGVELGGEESRDGTALARALDAGETIGGRLVLRRLPPEGTIALERVEPGLVERRAPRAPRWRAVFLDVPITPP